MKIFEEIKRPFKKSKTENELIRKNLTNHLDWSKDIFSDLKRRIKDHLRKEQRNQCCYCRTKLGFDIRQAEIEHIIAKSKNKNFSFISKNLALSCPGCNSSKSTKNVLNVPISNLFNRNSGQYKIIHPYYDKYSDHINIKGNIIFIGKTKKGIETIKICELTRLQFAVENAKQFYVNQSKTRSVIFKLIGY